MKKLLICALIAFAAHTSKAQQVIALYENGDVPFAKGGGEVPTLTIFKSTKGKHTGAAVIVCPGGGYGGRMSSYEGADPCKKLNEAGITAFLLDYRIPNDITMDRKEIVPLTDAQRAIQYVREHAGEYRINTDQIGIMGFSAGGHLAATAGTHFTSSELPNPKKTSLRPDFMVLVYPVISMQEGLTHQGSRENLLGKTPDSSLVRSFSNELQVTTLTSPAYFTHGMDDGLVKVDNSLLFYAALQQHKVPTSLMLYEHGRHGYGINNKEAQVQWIDDCIHWIKNGSYHIKN